MERPPDPGDKNRPVAAAIVRFVTMRRRALTGRQLDIVLALSSASSFREAGDRIGLSQPAMSRQVQTIESRLGVEIVARGPKGFELTDAGLRIARLARASASLEAEMMFELQATAGSLQGSLRICGFSSVARSVLVPAVSRLVSAHASLTAQVSTEELYLVGRRGALGEYDVFVTQVPLGVDGFESELVGHELNVLIEPVDGDADACTMIDHEPSDRFSEHYLTCTGLPFPAPLRRVFYSDIYGLIDGVGHGVGRAVVPLHLLRASSRVRQVPGTPVLKTAVVVNYSRYASQLARVRAALDAIRDVAARELDAGDRLPAGARIVEAPFPGCATAHRETRI